MFRARTVRAATLIAIAGLAVASCGRTAATVAGPGSGSAAAPTSAASGPAGSGPAGSGPAGSGPAASDPAASGPATGELNIWAQADEAAGLPPFAEEFMKANPGLKISITPLPWDAAHNKYQTAIAGGSTPDMAQMGTTWMGDFKDAFAPLPSSIATSAFFEGSVKSTDIGGVKYGVPWYVDTRVIYYRTDLAKKAGYDSFPTNWDDFKTFAKAMQTKAGAKWGITLPTSGGDSFQSMLFFPWSAGAQLMNSDQTKWTLDSPQFLEAMKYYQSFFTDGIANPSPDIDAGAAEAAFVDGSSPMLLAGPSGIGSISKAGGDGYKDKFSVGMVPKNKSATSFVGGSDLVVFKNSKNQDAAWKFIQWLSTPQVQVRWQQAVGDLPSVQSAWKQGTLATDPFLKVFGEQLKDTNSPPTVTTWTQVSAAADTVLEQIVKTGTDPAQALKALQATADGIGSGG
jgi:multiple sugar transport system substrate-binding protein